VAVAHRMAQITAASPARDPALMAEWRLLSSCIGDMEESDLMAFDEDLADYVPWDDEEILSPLRGERARPCNHSCAGLRRGTRGGRPTLGATSFGFGPARARPARTQPSHR
jgi:hypothetical protein